MQLLPRSATGERMNPYNSIWTGVNASDGPKNFHVVLMDNARTEILGDEEGRQTLNCIRCGALPECLPGLPSDRRPRLRQCLRRAYRCDPHAAVAGDAPRAVAALCIEPVRSVLRGLPGSRSTYPRCSSTCANKVVEQNGLLNAEALAMRTMGLIFRSERRFRAAQRMGRIARDPARPQRSAGSRLDRLAARYPRRLDPGPRPPGDAEADLPRLVRAARVSLHQGGRKWQMIPHHVQPSSSASARLTHETSSPAAIRSEWSTIQRNYRRSPTPRPRRDRRAARRPAARLRCTGHPGRTSADRRDCCRYAGCPRRHTTSW